MLGQNLKLVLPEVVGYKITGKLSPLATSYDVVLTITHHLRQFGVVGKFVEFFGSGVTDLSLADRATISSMCPEYGATTAFFPIEEVSMSYLRLTGRSEEEIALIKSYLKAVGMFRNYSNPSEDPTFSQVVELDLSTVVLYAAGPKRPQDIVSVTDVKKKFLDCLTSKVGEAILVW